jgi:uncharacterized protein
MNIQIFIPENEIAAFCQRWGIAELRVFGSVLREDFSPDSDIDILIQPKQPISLKDLLAMERELENTLGRKVDLGTLSSVEADPNYIRRNTILNSSVVIYAN